MTETAKRTWCDANVVIPPWFAPPSGPRRARPCPPPRTTGRARRPRAPPGSPPPSARRSSACRRLNRRPSASSFYRPRRSKPPQGSPTPTQVTPPRWSPSTSSAPSGASGPSSSSASSPKSGTTSRARRRARVPRRRLCGRLSPLGGGGGALSRRRVGFGGEVVLCAAFAAPDARGPVAGRGREAVASGRGGDLRDRGGVAHEDPGKRSRRLLPRKSRVPQSRDAVVRAGDERQSMVRSSPSRFCRQQRHRGDRVVRGVRHGHEQPRAARRPQPYGAVVAPGGDRAGEPAVDGADPVLVLSHARLRGGRPRGCTPRPASSPR